MLETLDQRTVVIGNSGSGKSVFAESLAVLARIPVIDLLHWEASGYGRKRNEAAARVLARDAAAASRWIIEGVYGWLAEEALPSATTLVWLDMPWSVCQAGLLARGRRRSGTDADFADLLAWSEAYWTRQTSSSFAGHLRLFESFSGIKLRLHGRHEVQDLLATYAAYRAAPS
jgi:adenylate kinase family enzyme